MLKSFRLCTHLICFFPQHQEQDECKGDMIILYTFEELQKCCKKKKVKLSNKTYARYEDMLIKQEVKLKTEKERVRERTEDLQGWQEEIKWLLFMITW